MHRIALATLLLATSAPLFAAAQKPNIIVIYSDDHGWADLGVQGSAADVRTPNLDALAKDGVRFTHGYVSAPQCVPSRAGVITGRYQQRFGVEDNGQGPLPLAEMTIAERLKPAGYVSCQIGKWHLTPPPERKAARGKGSEESEEVAGGFQPWSQGFDEYYCGAMNTFAASHDLQGKALADAPRQLTDPRFRCVWQADAAVSFIARHQREPFFLYLAFFAPHVPLQSPEPWFSDTSPDAPLERRQALAMIAAMDDGIGRLRAKLRESGIDKNTLIFFIGDNGAPLKQGAWNGSLNTPLTGEKGMLTDGGIRTPFLASWPGRIPAGQVIDAPVINLDVAATANAAAGLPHDAKLDGVDLMPYMLGQKVGSPHEALYWRWRSQAAVRADHWKYILLGKDERFLFDLDSPEGETKNRLTDFPDIAADLDKKLMAWNSTLPPPGIPRDIVDQDQMFYDAHLNKTGAVPAKRERGARGKAKAPPAAAWTARNGTLTTQDGVLELNPEKSGKAAAFIVRTGIELAAPVTIRLAVKASTAGPAAIAWRVKGDKDFIPENRATFPIAKAGEWETHEIKLPATASIIHLRVHFPPGVIQFREIGADL